MTLRRTKTATKRTATGPSREVRELVLSRAQWCCEVCGTGLTFGPYSLQHRRARGMGGSLRPDTNEPQNLLAVCGSATSPGGCHELIERRREWSRDHGWTLLQTDVPASSPVAIAGKGLTYLTASGGYSSTLPTEGASA